MFKSYSYVLKELFRRDLATYRKEFWSRLFDSCWLLFVMLVVFAYVMPEYGLPKNYGSVFLCAAIASFGFFDTIGKVSVMMADIEGDRTISYLFTLPLPSVLVLVYIMVWWAISSALNGIFLLPLGKLILWNQLDLGAISYWRLLLVYISVNVFYGVFSMWLAALFTKMNSLNSIWVRVLNPLYMFGGFWFPWKALFFVSPLIAYCSLINPIIYGTEGVRAAILGQGDYLPVWICILALWGFNILLGWHASSRLKRRLDCV